MSDAGITNETRLTRIHALVVEILSDLLRAPIDATDSTIQSAIARIGSWCRRDRSYVFVRRGRSIFNTHEWCGPGIDPAITYMQNIPWEGFAPITEPLEVGQPFHVPDVADLPEESAARALLEMQGIRSMLLVPMRHADEIYGFIGFDGVESTQAFLPGELYLLQSVADVIQTVLTRRDREAAVAAVQKDLSEERSFLASILATSAMGIMVIDAGGVIRFVNDAAARISGLPHEGLLGQHHDSENFLITRKGGEPFVRGSYPFDLVVATGAPAPETLFELHCPEGLRYCAIHATPVAGDGLRAARVVYAMLDVTEQVTAEKAREEALEEARRANQAKSNFLAKMSHEMRTPLNGVLGIAEVLERQLREPGQQRMIRILRDSGTLLLGIINDLLDMTKIEADRLEIEQIAFNIAELADRMEAVHTLKAADRHLSFGIQLLGDGQAPRLGDPFRLSQILHNLIGNAIKFTMAGEVAVVIDCRSPDGLRLSVRDTGIGMTSDQVATVFEEFGQADSSITRRFGGTGLGMTIVRGLVEMMQGSITLDSEPGKGTCVTVDLPIACAPADDTAQAAIRTSRRTASPRGPSGAEAARPTRRVKGPPAPADRDRSAQTPPASPDALPDFGCLRVLAADDNRTNRMILDAMLSQFGVSATLVPDGRTALQTMETNQFNLVILDISMPGLDGMDVMRRLRSRFARTGSTAEPAPLIIAFTANAMSHQVEGYMKAGFDACLTKPLKVPLLIAALTAALPENRARRVSRAAGGTPDPIALDLR